MMERRRISSATWKAQCAAAKELHRQVVILKQQIADGARPTFATLDAIIKSLESYGLHRDATDLKQQLRKLTVGALR